MTRLLFAAVMAAATMSGCCCDSGVPRLVLVDVVTDDGTLSAPVAFDGTDNELPIDGFFQAYRHGPPGPNRIRTTPLLELYDDNGARIPFERFLGQNDGGCARAEIYEAAEPQLSAGARYQLVHRASASPGDLEDSGPAEGDYASFIRTFEGEPALVAEIVVVESTLPPTGSSGAGGGMTDTGGSGGAGVGGGVGAGGAGG